MLLIKRSVWNVGNNQKNGNWKQATVGLKLFRCDYTETTIIIIIGKSFQDCLILVGLWITGLHAWPFDFTDLCLALYVSIWKPESLTLFSFSLKSEILQLRTSISVASLDENKRKTSKILRKSAKFLICCWCSFHRTSIIVSCSFKDNFSLRKTDIPWTNFLDSGYNICFCLVSKDTNCSILNKL